MSLLHNNIRALEMVSDLDTKALISVFSTKEPVSGCVTASVWNTDTERRKESLLEKNPAGVVAGLKILTLLSGAQAAVIVTAAEGVESELEAAARQVNLTLSLEKRADLVKFEHRNDLLVTLDEAASYAACLCGEEPGLLIAVDDGELQELPPETLVTDLVPVACKAVLTDHRFYAPAELTGLSLGNLGSRSGVLRILTEKDCLVDLAKKEISILREKSCGRCTFCREGLFQHSVIAEDLSSGRLKPQALDLARELADAMFVSTNCSLGEDAGNPMASLLRAFPQEVEAHARRRECPAGICTAFITFYIDPAKCLGSHDCVRSCPVHAIDVKPGFTSMIDSFDCIKCGSCLTACTQSAIVRVSGKARIPDRPARLKDSSMEETQVESTPEKREGGSRRKRSFARPAGASAPVKSETPVTPPSAPVSEAVPTPAPSVAPMPTRPASQPVVTRVSGSKRKRSYAKPIKPE